MQDRRTLAARRGGRLRTAMWQLALVMAANDNRAIRRSRKNVPYDDNTNDGRAPAQLRGDGSSERPTDSAENTSSAAAAGGGVDVSSETPSGNGTTGAEDAQPVVGWGGDPRHSLGRVRYGRHVPDDYG